MERTPTPEAPDLKLKAIHVVALVVSDMGVSEKSGYLNFFGGPYNKDPTLQGAILGSLILGNSH